MNTLVGPKIGTAPSLHATQPRMGSSEQQKNQRPSESPYAKRLVPQTQLSPALLMQYAGIRFGSEEPKADATAEKNGLDLKSMASDVISSIGQAEKKRYASSKEVLTFQEFVEEVIKKPTKHLRNSSQYTVDAIEYYNGQADIQGKTHNILGHDVQPMAYTKRPWEPAELSQRNGISGQDLVLQQVYDILKQNAKKKHPTRMITFHGPNATGKTLAINTLYAALEDYSRQDEGALYTFNWVFKDAEEEDTGFEILTPVASEERGDKGEEKPQSIKPDEVGVSIPANLHTNPIFLLDKQQRIGLINKLEEAGKLPKGFNKDFVISGSLDSSSQKIYNALWKLYDGDASKILSHVQVVRWNMSEQNRNGLVSIPPQETFDAHIQPITPDIDWNMLPVKIKEAFRSAGLHELDGPFPQANRGHILYDDQWKTQQLERYLFLLKTAEKGRMTIGGGIRGGGADAVEENLDLVIWATTNDENIAQLQQNYPDWKSMRERVTFVPVGYEQRYESVMGIYREHLNQLAPATGPMQVGPHVLEAFSLFAAMTALFVPDTPDYYKETIPEKDRALFTKAIDKLKDQSKNGLLCKALLYQGDDLNDNELDPTKQRFTPDEQAVLRKYLADIAEEYNFGVGKHKFLFYEGGIGLSPRDGKEILEEAVRSYRGKNYTVVELFDALEERIQHGLDYEKELEEFVGRAKQAISQAKQQNVKLAIQVPDFVGAEDLLRQTKTHMQRKIRYDVQQAMGVIKSPEDHKQSLRKYMEHLKALRGNTQVARGFREPAHSPQPSETFMKKMEATFEPSQFGDIKQSKQKERDEFRRELSETYSMWKAENDDNPEDNLDVIFPDLMKRLVAKDLSDNKEKLDTFLDDMKDYYRNRTAFEKSTIVSSDPKRLERVKATLGRLREMGYTDEVIPKLVEFAFNTPDYKRSSPSKSTGSGI